MLKKHSGDCGTKDRDLNVCGCSGNFIKAKIFRPHPPILRSCHLPHFLLKTMSVITEASSFHKTTHPEFLMSFFFFTHQQPFSRNTPFSWKFYLYAAASWRVQNFGRQDGILIRKCGAQKAKALAFERVHEIVWYSIVYRQLSVFT